jgi:hypothetical protein
MNRDADGLRVIRLVFAAVLLALSLFIYMLYAITEEAGTARVPAWVAPSVAVYGLGAVAAVSWLRSRPLDISDAASLAGSYRRVFYRSLWLAESAAWVGFGVVFLTSELWPYLEGLAFALVGLALIAPTGRDLERRHQQITAQGSPLSLVEALRTTPPGRPGARGSGNEQW